MSRRSLKETARQFLALTLAVALTFYPVLVRALPIDGKVVGGSANITQPNSTTLNINQATNKAIINWQGFSINVNELVKFNQPGAASSVLNRVTGVDPSSIFGRLIANGRVFIVNPAGIFFGPSAVVDVSGLFASTFNIKDSDFMAGKYSFSQDPAKNLAYVINKGEIKVSSDGFVFLVAPGVANESLIIANLGKVVMASGEKFEVDFMGDGLIKFVIDGKVMRQVTGPDGNPLSSAVSNTGKIQADGGQVVLAAKASKDIFSSVVNNSGVIEARSLVGRAGSIRLEGSDPVANTGQIGWQNNLGKVQNAEGIVINAGTLDVSALEAGAAPGEVTLSGQLVGVSVTILARGADGAQGGRVLITSTEKTVLTSTSRIDTSGIGNSSAGNAVIWSDRDTIYKGWIVARGGEFGGDGGNVEVSGWENLNFRGMVDLSAASGTVGTLLLDPATLTITGGTNDGAADGNNTFAGDVGAVAGKIEFQDATPTTVYESEIEGVNAAIVLEGTKTVTTAGDFTDDAVTIQTNNNLTIRTRNTAGDTAGEINLTA
ncbi:MAG: filamentous hemagglutinin N-terminal domain-containing protein, partial [Deltaproteobacteria bacterium]|nr:filamentous hemagglutinin N-terminal domain-containing protein [Deltaproteobacteria bacterium]